jgi:hypothetical protein
MPWNKIPKNITDDIYCPFCIEQGKRQKFACEIHDWVYRKWYRNLQRAFSQPSQDKKQTGFFGKPRE